MIYFIQADNGPVLITCANKDPLPELQRGNPRVLYVRAILPLAGEGALDVFHDTLAHLHLRGGWFKWSGVLRYLIQEIEENPYFDLFQWAAEYPELRKEMSERLRKPPKPGLAI